MTGIKKLLSRLDRAGLWIERGAIFLAASGFAVGCGAFIWTVFCRYVLHDPSTNSEELAVVVYLWVVTLGAAMAVRYDEHIAFDLLSSVLHRKPAAVLVGLGALVAGVILLATLPYTLDYINFLWREKTAVMRIPLNWLYLCFGIMQGALGLKLLVEALRQAVIYRTPTEAIT